MARLTAEDLHRFVEHRGQQVPGLGFVANGRAHFASSTHSPLAPFCNDARDKAARSRCATFYASKNHADAAEHICPFGFVLSFQPVPDIVQGDGGLVLQLARKADPSPDTLAQLPRRSKKVIAKAARSLPLWESPLVNDASAIHAGLRDELRAQLDAKQESALSETLFDYRDFIASFSHEALSPIQEIRLKLEKAINILRNTDPSTAKLIQSAISALDLVRTSLAGTRLLFETTTTGPLENRFGTVDAYRAAKHWCEIYSEQSTGKNVSVIFDPDAAPWSVWAIPEEFELLMRNLISNAFKYSFDASRYDRPGKVIVKYEATRARLSVTNFGVPIPEADIGSGVLFQLSKRGSTASDRGRTGQGVGLYLVKTIVEHHRASIHVSSEIENPGGWNLFARTTFAITFRKSPVR